MKLLFSTSIALLTWLFIIIFTIPPPVFPNNEKKIEDKNYHFQVIIPATWNVDQAYNQEQNIRLTASGTKDREIILYAVHSKVIIDFEKLIEYQSKLLNNEGTVESVKNLPDSFFVPWLVDAKGIIKTFRSRDVFTLFFAKAEGPYGYIMLLRGPDKNELNSIVSSFKVSVPTKEVAYALVNYLSVFILAAFLGESGFSFRKRLNKLSILKFTTGTSGAENIRNIIMLCVAPCWCIFLYLLGIYFLEEPTTQTIFMIIGPFLPVLGYFGIIREIPELEDYI